MERYYLWNDRIDLKGMNRNENPGHFFENIVVPDDRFSYSVSDFKSLLPKLSENKKSGYAYFLYSTGSGAVYGKITYTVKSSPAEMAGLKRGMVFTKINGTTLSTDNYGDLTSLTVHHHTLSVRQKNGMDTAYNVPVAELEENPVFFDTVYVLDNCRAGYVIYNSFISDSGDMSNGYAMQLNGVFERFGNENISELILDLRYNQKGSVVASVLPASMIVPRRDTDRIYAKYRYNESLQTNILNEFGDGYLNLYFTDMIEDKPINNVGNRLNRVFVLTSPKMGAAGEILINGLKPFIPVVIVGSRTAGNNVFSLFLYEEDPEKQRINTWAIVPAVMQIANTSGNTDYAFDADITVMEPLFDTVPLGDINETVLSATLNVISGKAVVSAESPSGDIKYNIIPQQLPLNGLYSRRMDTVAGHITASLFSPVFIPDE
jgi:hypothetical protein